MTFPQQAAGEVVGEDDFGGAGEEALGGELRDSGWSWWLWEWLDEKVLRDADRRVVAGL